MIKNFGDRFYRWALRLGPEGKVELTLYVVWTLLAASDVAAIVVAFLQLLRRHSTT